MYKCLSVCLYSTRKCSGIFHIRGVCFREHANILLCTAQPLAHTHCVSDQFRHDPNDSHAMTNARLCFCHNYEILEISLRKPNRSNELELIGITHIGPDEHLAEDFLYYFLIMTKAYRGFTKNKKIKKKI